MKPGDEGAVVRFPSRIVRPVADAPPARTDPLWRELVGQVLRSERVELGRTLQQVSERAGVSAQYLSEVERGRKDPSSEMLEFICGAVGLRLVDLLAAASARLTNTVTTTAISTTSIGHLGVPRARPYGVISMAA